MDTLGLIVVDKPVGPTSHHVVNVVRKGTGIRKVGHAGTLDPRASGVLVLCLGSATRLSEYLSTSVKRYEAVVRFGQGTETYDSEGNVTLQTGRAPARSEIEAVLPEFRGEISQVPPPYSAIKIQGRKAYELARAGKPPDLEPRQVTISELIVTQYDPPDLLLTVECSAGTYIRSLANDLGERLAVGAHLAALRRTKAGPFALEDTIRLAKLEAAFADGSWQSSVIPAIDALPELQIVYLDQAACDRIRNGQQVESEPGSSGMARGVDQDGNLVAVLEAVEDGSLWHPRKVFLS